MDEYKKRLPCVKYRKIKNVILIVERDNHYERKYFQARKMDMHEGFFR